jgi:hypothetical protein
MEGRAAVAMSYRERRDMTAHPNDECITAEAVRMLTESAVRNVPGVDHASVTVRHRDDTLETAAATSDVAHRIDQLQYRLREGPCYDAVTDERFVLVGDVAHHPGYPRYGPVAAGMGARAQLAMQLTHDDGRVAGLNLYAEAPHALGEDALQMAELFAAHAAVMLGYARKVETLTDAVRSRTEIGMAVGVVMERHGVDPHRAFQYLVRLSNDANVKLRLIARRVIDGEPLPGDDYEPADA